MLSPVTSDGSKSGVNCIRLKSALMDLARDFASVVLPVPGTSSSRTCPPDIMAVRIKSIVSELPIMIFSILVLISFVIF